MRNFPSPEALGKETLFLVAYELTRVSTRSPKVPEDASKDILQRFYFIRLYSSGNVLFLALQKIRIFPSAVKEGNVSKLSSDEISLLVINLLVFKSYMTRSDFVSITSVRFSGTVWKS